MEPLIQNIENNDDIEAIWSEDLRCKLPKVAAYADDVNTLIRKKENCLRELFKEYERLTKLSGLELNADKTVLLLITSRNNPNRATQGRFKVQYANKEYNLVTCQKTKINGILFQQDYRKAQEDNVANAIKKMDNHFKAWTRRNLTTLGKITIAKTFGISQVIFLMQSMTLTDIDFKAINSCLYKFIWNRHYLAAKAPERLKREIMNKPVKAGGFGMLDIVELDRSLKLKALGRLTESNHPFLSLIREKVDYSDYLNPKIRVNCERITLEGIGLLKGDRYKQVKSESSSVKVLSLVKHSKIKDLLTKQGQISLWFFELCMRNKNKICDLEAQDFQALGRFLQDKDLRQAVQNSLSIRNPVNLTDEDFRLFYNRPLNKLTSKIIREIRNKHDPECIYKIGLILNPYEAINWGKLINSLKSVRHKNNLLKVAHGEVYSCERKFNFGLEASPNCKRCNQVEAIVHKLFECPHVKRIWEDIIRCTNKLLPVTPNCDLINRALGTFRSCTLEALTIQMEALTRLLYQKIEDPLLPPKTFTRIVIKTIAKRELGNDFKNTLEALLLEND